MIEADRINSTFYAMRLLSHRLPLGQVEINDGADYPATEFTVNEQLSAFEILRHLGADAPDRLSSEQIQAHLDVLASDIEIFANSVLAEAGYDLDFETKELLDKPGVSERKPGAVASSDQAVIQPATLIAIFSGSVSERVQALSDLGQIGGERAFELITEAFDAPDQPIRNAAVRALIDLDPGHVGTFTRALREASEGRRRRIGEAIFLSGLAQECLNNLTSEVRERAYDAFSIVFLMAKAGEWRVLIQAIEDHPDVNGRLAIIRLLTLVPEPQVVSELTSLFHRGLLPSVVRSAVMDAILKINSKARAERPSVA